MATISISGTNNLAERIIGEAEEEARGILKEAELSALEIRNQSDKAVAAKRAELSHQRESAKKTLISGYMTRASLDGKKDALKKKRVIIDAAFSRAYASILALNAEAKKQICERMLEAEAEGGETVVPAKADRAILKSLIASKPEKKLSLSADDAKIDGGFVLLGNGYEKDCSYLSLLSVVRGEEETAVYQLLFD